jgi:MATE family multidrug resistance protein
MHQSLTIGLVLALPLTLICFFGATFFMWIMGAEPDVVPLGALYMQIVAPTLVASGLMFVGNAALRGAGDTRTPMLVMAVVNGVNIVVACVLIYGFGPFPALGVAGSALGAAIGRTSGCVIVVLLLLQGRSGLRLSLPHLRPDIVQLRRIINVGLPAGMELLIMRLGMTIFAAVVASLGTDAYAAHQVVMTSESISFQPGFGFGVAAATLVGQGLGARDTRRAEDGALMSIQLALAVMSGMGCLFFFFPQVFMAIFTSDPQVIALGIVPLRIIGIAQPFLALTMTIPGALRGAGDTRGPLVVTTIGIWCVRLPLAFLLISAVGLGLPGAWMTMIIDQAFRSVFFIRRFRIGQWKLVRV